MRTTTKAAAGICTAARLFLVLGLKSISTHGFQAFSTGGSSTTDVESQCDSIVIHIEGEEHDTHTGLFTQTGVADDSTPIFQTEGGYVLHFVDTEDFESSGFDSYMRVVYSAGDDEPSDGSLENPDFETIASDDDAVTGDRRFLVNCGYWVIGKKGDSDAATYPMIKASDCAGHPVNIDQDVEWTRQNCYSESSDTACDPTIVADVTISCESPPSPSPTSLRGTPSPVDETTAPVSASQAEPTAAPAVIATQAPPAPALIATRAPLTPAVIATRAPLPTPAPEGDAPATPEPTMRSDVVVPGVVVPNSEEDSGGDSVDEVTLGVGLGVGAAVLIAAGVGIWAVRK